MKKTYWFASINPLLHCCLLTNCFNTGVKEISLPISEPNMMDWNEYCQCIKPSTEWTKSQLNEIKAFWRKGNEHMKYRWDTYTLQYPEVVQEMNGILFSSKANWDSNIIKLINEFNEDGPCRNPYKKQAILESLFQFLLLKDIPLKVLQVTHFGLFKIMETGRDSIKVYYHDLWDWVKKTFTLNKGRYFESFKDFSARKDYLELTALQKTLGEYGIRIVGDWYPEDQKKIFEFWIFEKLALYFQIKEKPNLQLVLETQFVQTRLIGVVKTINSIGLGVPDIVMDWAYSCLRNHSGIVVNYIKSLREESDITEFISIQKYIIPYRLHIPEDMKPTDQLKCIEFWSSHVDIFLIIKRIEKTKGLQRAVEDLVIKDFNEICIMMRKFLDQPEIIFSTKTVTQPALLKFLEFYSDATQSDQNSQFAEKAIAKFREPVFSDI
ncbi:hypothetical protein DFH28DRAFT_946716 [Melampsora americana]|nr:hypothetical protein DFH28DRAFT_946716 [Melampsora americana]